VRFARQAGLALCIIGFLLMGRSLFDAVGGRIYQAWYGGEVDRILQDPPPAANPDTTANSFETGSAIGRLEIPRLGLSVVVLEGSDTGTLRLGVGRLRGSSWAGDPGNIVLAGHRDTFFRSLRQIRPGARISLRTTQGTFLYTVGWTKVVNPTDTGDLQATAAPALTLVTCYPFYYVGPAPQRFLVRAMPPGAISAASAADGAAAPRIAPAPHVPVAQKRRLPAIHARAAAEPTQTDLQAAAAAPELPVAAADGAAAPRVAPAPHVPAAQKRRLPAIHSRPATEPTPPDVQAAVDVAEPPVAAAADPPAQPPAATRKPGFFHRLARVFRPQRATLR
jgi:sortase A